MAEISSYDWDSKIGKEADENAFVVLPAGKYSFEVTNLERGRYEGNPQKGTNPCPKATVSLRVFGGDGLGEATVKENIFLSPSSAWKIKEFFVCLGLVEADTEEFQQKWNDIVGCSGTCTLKKRQYEKDGEIIDTNDVKKFLPPTNTGTAPASEAAPAFSFPAGA